MGHVTTFVYRATHRPHIVPPIPSSSQSLNRVTISSSRPHNTSPSSHSYHFIIKRSNLVGSQSGSWALKSPARRETTSTRAAPGSSMLRRFLSSRCVGFLREKRDERGLKR